MKLKISFLPLGFILSLLSGSNGFGIFGNFGNNNNGNYNSNPAIKLLESQLKIAANEQQQVASRLIQAGLRDAQSELSKLKFVQAVQSAISNTLANKGLSDLNNIQPNDIRSCYQENRFSFSDAMNTAKAQVTQCLVDKFNQAQSIVQNGRSNIENAFGNLANVGQIISECSQLTNTFPSLAGVVARGACLNKAILSIRTDTILLPIQIAKRIIEIRESIASTQADMIKCGFNVIEAIYTQSTHAGQAIINCINGISTTTAASSTA